MSGLTIDDDILRRKRDPYENMDMYGINPAQQGGQKVGGANGGALSEFGIPISIVEEAKNTNIFYAAQKAEGIDGSGAGATFAPINTTVDTGLQTDSIFSNQPIGDITVPNPNASGTKVMSSALDGAAKNENSSNQRGGPTDEQKQQNYQFSHDGNMTSIAYSGNGEGTSPLSGNSLNGLNARLGMPSGAPKAEGKEGAGEATLTTSDEPKTEKPSGDATLTATDEAKGPNDTKGAEGSEGGKGAEGPDGEKTSKNANQTGNEENKYDASNGADKQAQQAKTETAEQEAKRIVEEQAKTQQDKEAAKKAEEMKARQQGGH